MNKETNHNEKEICKPCITHNFSPKAADSNQTAGSENDNALLPNVNPKSVKENATKFFASPRFCLVHET
jgi:hypothetical protein